MQQWEYFTMFWRIFFSVIFVVLFCSVTGCGQAHTAIPATPASTHIVPTPTHTSAVLGHAVTDDGWEITLTSARFDDTYPVAAPPDISDDWLLVLHLVVKNVSNQDALLIKSQLSLINLEQVSGSALAEHGVFNPEDQTKGLADQIPVGTTAQGDLVYALYKGGLAEHGVVHFALNFLATSGNPPLGGGQLFTFSAS